MTASASAATCRATCATQTAHPPATLPVDHAPAPARDGPATNVALVSCPPASLCAVVSVLMLRPCQLPAGSNHCAPPLLSPLCRPSRSQPTRDHAQVSHQQGTLMCAGACMRSEAHMTVLLLTMNLKLPAPPLHSDLPLPTVPLPHSDLPLPP